MKRRLIYIISGIVGGFILTLLLLIFLSGFLGMGNTIAVIPVYGEIGHDPYGTMGYVDPGRFQEMIDKANEDPSVSAIVVDINSPGGSVVAGIEISEMIKKSKKPVIARISDVGTSAAYLIASSCDKVVANPSSMVGSIGVIMELSDFSDYYDKMGQKHYSLTSGEYKDMGANYRSLKPEERKMLQEMLDENYDFFIEDVAKNRNLSVSKVKTLADGKLYSGNQALKLKLIDKLGGKEEAFILACNLSNISNETYIVHDYTNEFFGFNRMVSSTSSKFSYNLGRGIGDSFSINNYSGSIFR